MEEFAEKLYQDAYCTEIDTVVRDVKQEENGCWIALEDTVFYPESGGQPCDTGTINGYPVDDVQKKEDAIWHHVSHVFDVGEQVHGCIDWNRRFEHMQNHSGEHIVSGLIHKHYGYDNVGFHMGNDAVQIDFDGVLNEAQVRQIEQEANQIIWQNKPVTITFPDEDELKNLPYRSKKELTGKVRIVVFEDADICACCGTHVANTGEIGLVKMLSTEKTKRGTRITMASGMTALHYMNAVKTQNDAISTALSANVYETSQAVDALLARNDALHQEIMNLHTKMFELQLSKIQEGDTLGALFFEDIPRNLLVQFCNRMMNEKNVSVSLVCSGSQEKYSFIMMSKSVNLKDALKQFGEKLKCRGGGKPDVIQGSMEADQETIVSVLREIFV